MLVFAAIAIPIDLRPLSSGPPDITTFQALDFGENVAGFVPVGIVLADLGWLSAGVVATLLTVFAEASQLAMVYRGPSAMDVAANVIGALLGIAVCKMWGSTAPELPVSKWKAWAAVALAFSIALGVRLGGGDGLNDRGVSAPGTLEAHWKFDGGDNGRIAEDSSGHHLHGKFHGEPKRIPWNLGGIVLDGAKDYVDFGHSSAFRLAGSMTLSAWINPSGFPTDDAAIISQLDSGLGYQLDTTVDKGPRTIGFKLTNSCGQVMARYGATPVAIGKWSHVAGVYNANSKTLDVYLDGKLDNGFLLGQITGTQHTSRAAVYVGRRSDFDGFEFAGSIRDVRIYSTALDKNGIDAAMRGDPVLLQTHRTQLIRNDFPPCASLSEPEDAKKFPIAAAAVGILVAFAFVGFWPASSPVLCLATSLVAGMFVLLAISYSVPVFSRWMIPITSLAGGGSVVLSIRRPSRG